MARRKPEGPESLESSDEQRHLMRRYRVVDTGRVIEVEILEPDRVDGRGQPDPYWFASSGEWFAEGSSFGGVMTAAIARFGPLEKVEQ